MQNKKKLGRPSSVPPTDKKRAPSAAALFKMEVTYMTSEMDHMWERYAQLQKKNQVMTSTILRLYIILFAFAAAPFTLQYFSATGISSVWGFGGVWLAITAWFYCDRAFRAYGVFWFEKIFCLRQIAQIRKMMVGESDKYNEFSLFRTRAYVKTIEDNEKERVHGPTHISRSQVTYTVYFYKIVSLFQPLYLLLFISLIILPKEMTDPHVGITQALFLRVLLGFSFILFIWLKTSMDRCFGLLKNAFRARRISRDCPWPRFPDDKKNELHFPGSQILSWSLWASAFALSIVNLIRFLYLLSDKQRDFRYWWTSWDWHLAVFTFFLFTALAFYHELDVRYVMQKAKRQFRRPSDI
jgi:hypothetical protein